MLVGINLLREGLDLPEVSLVAILDADKEGFLRSAGSLIQTSGRAARNVNGRVIMYADSGDRFDAGARSTRPSRRRALQEAYNEEHGITPQSIVKQIDEVMSSVYERDYMTPAAARDGTERFRTQAELDAHIATLQDADARGRGQPRLREGGRAPRRDQAPAQPRAGPAAAGAEGLTDACCRSSNTGSRTPRSRCRSTCAS